MKPSVHPSNKRARNKALRDAKQARARQRVNAIADNIRLREENAQLRAFCVAKGICLCQSAIEDPGPEHLAACPWGDERYAEEACACEAQKRGPRGICETCAGEIAFAPSVIRGER